jgi:hypothetical protein
MDPIRNPYAPGAGSPPPELAGRGALRKDIEVRLERLRLGRPAKSMTILVLQLDEPRYFSPAWGTPCCPEIEDNCLSAKIGEAYRIAFQVHQREIRCLIRVSWDVRSHMGSREDKQCGNKKKRSSNDESKFHSNNLLRPALGAEEAVCAN